MNEEYLKGYFNSYVKPKKSDAVYEDWVAKISTNEEYKRGMFNTYVKPQKADAIYEDWNTKIFGTTQPTVEQKKNTPVPTQNKVAETKENKGFSFEQLTSGASGIAGIDKSAADNNSDKTVKPALNVQSVVETNLGVPFINRIVKPDLYEPIKNADGTVSTHKLAYAESDGKFVVFPTIQENDTQDALIDLSKNDKDIEKAYNRAIKNKDFLEFDTEEDARQFAEGAWKDVYKGYESAPEYGKFVKEVTPRRMQVMADMPTQQSEISVDYEQERNFWKSEEGQQLSNELKYFNNKQRLYGDGGKYEGYVGGLVRKADEIMTGSIAGNLWMMLNSIQLNPTATGASIDIDATMKNYRSWYGQLAEDINTAKTKEVSEDSEFTSKFRELSMLWMTMAADVPVFGAIGKAAACATMAVGDLFAPIVKATPKFEKLLTPIVKQTLASSSTMGATLGMYEGGMDIANQLGTKPLNEFNYEQNLKSFGHGYATGVAVGGTMGLTNFARSKMLSSMYEKLVMTGKTGNMPLNVANNMAKAIGFGAEATVFSNASTLLDEGRFSTIDEIVNTAVELAVIKSTQPTAFMPKNNLISVVEGMTPEKVGKGRFNVDYNDYEKTLDVKLFDEKGNLNGKELKDAISNDVPLTYIQKRLWERGIMLNMSAKTYDVGVEELDGKYYVRLTDKVGKTISLEQYADKAEADANAVTAAYMVRDRKVFESFAELSATDKAEVDANFNGDKELLRQAWGKNPFERNNYEKEVINEFKNVVDKQVAEKDKKEQSKQKENDKKDEAGVSGEVREGQEPIEAEPVEKTGKKEISDDRSIQTSEKEAEIDALKKERDAINDEQEYAIKVESIDEIPEQYKDRAEKMELSTIPTSMWGLLFGKVTKTITYIYKIKGSEYKTEIDNRINELSKEVKKPTEKKLAEEPKKPEVKKEQPKVEEPQKPEVAPIEEVKDVKSQPQVEYDNMLNQVANEVTRGIVEKRKAKYDKEKSSKVEKLKQKLVDDAMKNIKSSYNGFVEHDNTRYRVNKNTDGKLVVSKFNMEKNRYKPLNTKIGGNKKIKSDVIDKFIKENGEIVDIAYDYINNQVKKYENNLDTKFNEDLSNYLKKRGEDIKPKETKFADKEKPDFGKYNIEIPYDVLKESNNVFEQSAKANKNKSIAIEDARNSIKNSDWYNGLDAEQRGMADRQMDAQLEGFAKEEVSNKSKMKPAELLPAMEGTQTLKNREIMNIISDTAKRASKSIANLVKDVKTIIKDAKKNGKLTDAEHNAILTGIEKTTKGRGNFETKKQALLDYVETKLIGAEMRQDVQTARANIAKLRGNVRNKRNFYGDRFNQVKEATNIDLNTTDAETIKQYNDIVSEFLKIAKKPTKEQIDKFTKDIAELEFTPTEKKVKTKEDLDKYVEKASATEVTDAKSFRTALNQVRRAKSMAKKLESEGKITEAELTDVMDKVETNSDSIASKLKDKEVEIKKDLTKEIDKTVKDIVKELAKGNDLGLNEYELADIKKAIIKLKSKAVKKNMTVADADLIAYAMSNIKDGFINGDTFDAINKISTFEQYGKWREVYENIRDSRRFRQLEGYKQGVKIPFTQKVIKTKGETNRNTDQTAVAVINSKDSHRLGQYFGSLGHGLMEAFVGTTTRNIGTAKKYIAKLSNESGFNEASKNLRGSFFKKNFNKTGYDNSKRNIAFILTERMYQSNEKTTDHKNYWDAVIERMNISKAKNPKQFERDKAAWETMKKDKSLWNSDGSLNVEEAYKRLTPAEKKYYDSIIRLNEKMEQLMKYATEKNGRRYVALNNYDFFHIIREKDVGTEDKNEPKKVKDIVSSFMPATKPAGSTFERNMTPKYINTDLDVVIREQIKEANYDVFVARDFLANQRAIDMIKKDIGKEGTIGYKVFDAFQQSAKKRLVIEQNKQLIDDANRVANNVISLFSKKVLAMPTRVINELVTNLERQFLGQGKFDVAINKTDKQAYGDLMSDYIHNTKDYGNYSEYYGDSKTKAGKSVEWLLTFSDKSVVPMTFKTEFDKVFKRETGKAFDAESYNNDYMYRYKMSEAIEKASMAAIARSEELFNVKTPLGASPNLMFYKIMGKTASAERSSPLAKSLFFLQSFNHNELNQVKRAGLKFVNGVKEKDAGLIRMGIVDLFAISASNLTYLMIGRALREMSKPLFAYIFSGGDKDDVIGDINENMAKFMEENMTEKALTGQIAASLYSLSLGKYGAMTPALSGMLLGTLKKQVDKGDEEYDKTYAGLEDLAEQAYVRPIDINGYGSVTSFAKSLNPVISEVIVGLETLQMGVDEGIKAVREDEDVDTVNLIIFLNSVFNYAMLNPMTNYVDKQLRYYKRVDDKIKKEEKKNERSGSKREGDKREPDERKGIYR